MRWNDRRLSLDWRSLVPKHEQYEELSTLAMIGEASAAELKDLKEHLEHCPDCRQEYFEFVQFVLPQLSLAADTQPIQELRPEDREAIRSDFLAKATKAGIRFSDEALARPASSATPDFVFSKSPTRPRPWFVHGLEAGLAILLVAGVFFLGRSSAPGMAALSAKSSQTAAIPPKMTKLDGESPAAPNPSVAETRIAELHQGLDETTARLQRAMAALAVSG